jgi:hypothetical protein
LHASRLGQPTTLFLTSPYASLCTALVRSKLALQTIGTIVNVCTHTITITPNTRVRTHTRAHVPHTHAGCQGQHRGVHGQEPRLRILVTYPSATACHHQPPPPPTTQRPTTTATASANHQPPPPHPPHRRAEKGECEKNPGYMVQNCPVACNLCDSVEMMDPNERCKRLPEVEPEIPMKDGEKRSRTQATRPTPPRSTFGCCDATCFCVLRACALYNQCSSPTHSLTFHHAWFSHTATLHTPSLEPPTPTPATVWRTSTNRHYSCVPAPADRPRHYCQAQSHRCVGGSVDGHSRQLCHAGRGTPSTLRAAHAHRTTPHHTTPHHTTPHHTTPHHITPQRTPAQPIHMLLRTSRHTRATCTFGICTLLTGHVHACVLSLSFNGTTHVIHRANTRIIQSRALG